MELAPPVYLESGVLTWLTSHAQSKGTTLNALVNELLKNLSPAEARLWR